MRRIITLFTLVFLLATGAKATHLMGGEITAVQLQDSMYFIKLTTYRDTIGIPMATSVDFTLRDSTNTIIQNFSIPYDTSTSGNLLPLYPYGVEVYYFSDTIVLPYAGKFEIGFRNCCRNGAIQNMTQPLNESMYLTTSITYFDTASNSTPFFLVRPVIFLPVNTTWNYNPLPFDVNGDSLVWSIDTPLTKYQTNVLGYVDPPSATGGTFSMNATTGTISWKASTIGNFDASILVEEYRNGVKIGEIRRDMQFIVVQPSGSMAYISNLNQVPSDPSGNYSVSLPAEQIYSFSFLAEDQDVNDVVHMEAFGEPFLFSSNRAHFSVRKTGKSYGNEVEGTFSWYPSIQMVREEPYIVVYRVSDGTFSNDVAVLYKVEAEEAHTIGQTVGIGEFDNADDQIGRIFPNPTNGLVHVPLNLKEDTQMQIEVYSVNGELVQQFGVQNESAGAQLKTTHLNLESGQYLMLFKNGQQLLDAQSFLMVE